MRVVKVRIRRGDMSINPSTGKPREPMMVYPDAYNAEEVDRYGGGVNRLNMAQVAYSGEIGREGGGEEYLFIALPDDIAERYAQDPDMMVVTSTVADVEMEQARINNNVPEQVISAPEQVKLLQEKQAAKIPLTQGELDILDPTKPVKGINKGRYSVSERVQVDDDLSKLPKKVKEFQKRNVKPRQA